ncbi:hypothetical protein vBBak6_029 [Bacillus phage v_B-Bak6]|uniref:Uncharacterized protein n=1 Tax=Bacillus phage Basilisk TaxID=1296654 RepID=S5M4B3_9CAUD|nr:hypothetical protein PP653_gp130 [Bacillus phage Basilisk]AGR46696.1 hypothetical protein BASILISK_37 [Bacillus phage Basilisk]AXY82989.1 hypothetical protein vBBak1_029 [Bacillus phage v_B-Bak1]AXY83109.1 hypothetical protein vBBak6_029 [Bacillus phage v_B-Bak6]
MGVVVVMAVTKKFVLENIFKGALFLNFQGVYLDKWAVSGGKITLTEDEMEFAKMNFPETLAKYLVPIGFKYDKDIEVPEFEPSYFFDLRADKREEILNKLKVEQLEELNTFAEINDFNEVTKDVIKTKLLLTKAGK